jgi:leader peptidase (prepilin peptidase) / N-methyltransferase
MSIPPAVAAALLGGAAAAFLPRVAHRLAVPWRTPPRSACAACARPFPAGLPGWVRAGAPCSCRAEPLWRTVLTSAASAGLLAVVTGPSMLLVAVVVGVLLAEIDVRCLRLPDPIVAALAVVAVAPPAVRAVADGSMRAFGAVLAVGGLVGAGYLILALVSGGALGLGDVKLATVLAVAVGFAGPAAVAVFVASAHLVGGAVAVVGLVRGGAGRRTALPFGPALLVGAWVAVLVTGGRAPPLGLAASCSLSSAAAGALGRVARPCSAASPLLGVAALALRAGGAGGPSGGPGRCRRGVRTGPRRSG